MNEEFKKLFSNLSEKDQKEVANLIRFKNEVKYHDKQFEELLEQYIELSREHDKLKDNWNKLKEWLEEQKDNRKYANDVERFTAYGATLDKMREIEGGMNE